MAPSHSIRYERVASSSTINSPKDLVDKRVRFTHGHDDHLTEYGRVREISPKNTATVVIIDDSGREWDAHWLTLEVETHLPRPVRVRPKNTFTHAVSSRQESLNSGITDVVWIHFGVGEGGGVEYELSVKWHLLSGNPTPRLEIFSDTWRVFNDVPELFEMFAEYHAQDNDPRLTPEKLCEELVGMGFVDENL